MTDCCCDPDPYAELDYRADAGELSEEFRKPVRVRLERRHGRPRGSGGFSVTQRRNPL